jgi:hypothetical protein
MSALPSEADIRASFRHVCFGPGPDIQTSGDTDDLSNDYVTINGDGLIKPQVVRDWVADEIAGALQAAKILE